MAEVWLVRRADPEAGPADAVWKRLHTHLSDSDDLLAIFELEARLGVFVRHENLCRVLEFDLAARPPWMLLEYVDGGDLKRLMAELSKKNERLPLSGSAHILLGLLCGLEALHGATDENGRPLNIVHRDVNPSNILLSRLGKVKLSDFGMARSAWNRYATAPGVLKGRFAYLGPERARGEDPGGVRSDLFSVGVVAFELFSGRRLFYRNGRKATLEAVQRAEIPIISGLPEPLENWLSAMLAADPADRPENARQAGETLLKALRDTGITPDSASLRNDPNKTR